jgi:hypothetical protein
VNRDDVDVERLAGAAVFVLGFALLDVPATPVEYALCGVVVVGSLAAAVGPLRANRTFRIGAGLVYLGVGGAKLVGALSAPNVVTAMGLDGLFSLLLVADLLGAEYRRRRPLPE